MRNLRPLAMMALALVLAVVSVMVAARWISRQTTVTTNKVAVAQTDINLGSRLAPETFKMVDWPANAMPPGAFTDAKLLDGRVARSNVQRGEPIMEGKLAPPGTQGGLSAVVAPGKRAMTVRVNDVVGVAGFALPGNFVDILVNTQEEQQRDANGGKEQSISKIVLERILVLAIAQESSSNDTKPRVVNAVTLELTPEQAEALDLARSVGTLSLVLRNQIDPKSAPTVGATKSSLLGIAAPPKAAPAAAVVSEALKPAPRRTAAATPERAMDKVEVIKGLDRSVQQF
ncbi:MAG: Flp pilus assembly protein CpaB [Pseudomonadota bacterium]